MTCLSALSYNKVATAYTFYFNFFSFTTASTVFIHVFNFFSYSLIQ